MSADEHKPIVGRDQIESVSTRPTETPAKRHPVQDKKAGDQRLRNPANS
jgi:hypothetical protein